MHANDGEREPMDLRKVKCFKFQQFGHFTNKCSNRSKIGETHANVGTEEMSNNNMDGLMSTLEIDADADHPFEGFDMVINVSTKR